ncbi:Beta-secretase 2 [Podochytrium sp. JEL0797]|nr:Beta-secretase 2 [Podochytrium sp. JEL0797]
MILFLFASLVRISHANVIPLHRARVDRAILNATSLVFSSTSSFEQQLSGGPLVTGCYNIDIYVSGEKFNVQVDSGSSDLLIPGSTIESYTGPQYSTLGKTPISPQLVGATFADTSSWSGQFFYDTVGIEQNTILTHSPFAVMMHQTTNPVVTDGTTSQGLLGLAYDSLSSVNDLKGVPGGMPITLLSALSGAHAIAADAIAFRSCPANSATASVVDWGMSDPSLTCTPVESMAWIQVVSETYYMVNVTSITIGAAAMVLGVGWQQGDGYSIFDSCTTIMQLPAFAYSVLVKDLMEGGGFVGVGAKNLALFLNQGYGLSNVELEYTKMPDLVFTLMSEDGATDVEMRIPPQGYIQLDGQGNYYFTVGSQDAAGVVFGATVFDNFYVVLDRGGRRVGLGLGCDCAT